MELASNRDFVKFFVCSKPLNYAIALNELGADIVHSYVGQEPSGRKFNDLELHYNSKLYIIEQYLRHSRAESFLKSHSNQFHEIFFVGKKLCMYVSSSFGQESFQSKCG